jgi:hypothetical protein
MNRNSLRRGASLAAQSIEWVILAILLAACVPLVLLRPQTLTLIPSFSLLDGSWVLDTSYKASTGLWFGRDVAFTYGPLFQWLSSAPSRWIGLSTGSVEATWYALPLLLMVVCTFVTARLLLPEAAAFRRALLVLLAVVFWSPPDVRVAVTLLAFAIFLRLTQKVTAMTSAVVLLGVAAASICMAAFLLSADTGVYSVAALVLCGGATAITVSQRRRGRLALFVAVAVGCGALLMVLTNTVMLSPLDFKFWKSSLAIATGYRWFEPLPMVKANKRLVLESLALGMVVFGAAWFFRRPRGRWTARPAFLLSGFCLGFVMLQTSLVRSDAAHVLLGIYPIIFLCGAIALDERDGPQWLSRALPFAAVIATLALAHPFPAFRLDSVRANWQSVRHPPTECPAGFQEFDHACFPPSDAAVLSGLSVYVGLNAGFGESIAIFPYETTFGLTSRHPVAGGVMQSYLVNGDYLTTLEVAGLQKASPPFGLYFPDGIVSDALDQVPNFTRSPGVWFYLLRHYHAEASLMPAVVGLVRDDTREGRLSFATEQIGDAVGPVRVNRRSTAIDLGQIRWPAEGADFLKLRVRVNYPPWWRLRKPSRLTLVISLADGSQKPVGFVVEPDRATDVWIYPWNHYEMGRYFLPDESEWRPVEHPAVTALKLLITPHDWISVVPNSVSVERVETVRLGLK